MTPTSVSFSLTGAIRLLPNRAPKGCDLCAVCADRAGTSWHGDALGQVARFAQWYLPGPEDRDSRRPSLERRRSRLKASRGPPDGLGLDNGEDGATLPEPGSK
jgi:hypothetical protein